MLRSIAAVIAALALLTGLLTACAGNGSAAPEPSLAALLQKAMPYDMVYFTYDDFAADGNFEAFAVCAQTSYTDNEGRLVNYDTCQLWYADKSGARMLEDDLYGYAGNSGSTVTAGADKFIVWELSAGGSGSQSIIYGVRDGEPYQPLISRKYEWFCCADGKFQAQTNDLRPDYHAYVTHYFDYDASTGEFAETGTS